MNTTRRKGTAMCQGKCRRQIRLLAVTAATAWMASAIQAAPKYPAVFDVHLVPDKFTLYTDPYNGNQIKVGGFSGLFPVPGKPDSFYAVTDRGPTPDFKFEGVTLKTFAAPDFGPHLVTLDLQPNGKAMIRDLRPLTRPDGVPISGRPTTKTIEQLNTAGLAAHGIVPVTKTVVIDSLTAIDPLLEKCEGVCVVGNSIILTYDNDFNVADDASIPTNPNPEGPLVQLELRGANLPKIFVVPLPALP